MSRTNDASISIQPLAPDHATACDSIARALPAWFGIEEGLWELRHAAETQPGFIASIDGDITGFVTLERHFPETWEITWMAVHPDHHRTGIGRRLIIASITRGRDEGVETLLVKTLADTHPSPEYARTRAFYQAMGFRRLQVFPELWGPHNPCLLMARMVT